MSDYPLNSDPRVLQIQREEREATIEQLRT